MQNIETSYISSGCNRTPYSADWGRNNLICYGSCNAVAICRPEGEPNEPGEILHTLTGHRDRVNCVCWTTGLHFGSETELVSGSVDKTAIVWQHQNNQFKVSQVLSGHSGPVTSISTHYVPPNPGDTCQGGQPSRTVIVTTSVDSSVKIWCRLPGEEFECTQTLTYGTGFILHTSLILLPDTDLLMLACAGDDHKVHIYVENSSDVSRKFDPSIALSGHDDWVRSVDFTIDDGGDILLASAAQDYMIRVWRFSPRDTDTHIHVQSVLDLPLDKDIQMRENTFTFHHNESTVVYAVALETVLSGHENWIYSVRWHPANMTGGRRHQEMCLLSVSMDKTMILWRPDTASGVWMEQVRVGGVGGNTLGLYGGMFGPDGGSILAHSYQGAFHHWAYNQETQVWDPKVTVGGHFDSVEDLDWDRAGGNFLLSASLDESVRLHAPWIANNRQVKWYEIARPQVHGYAMQCLAMIHRYRFASAADEKVVRVFDAPGNFIENFCNTCGLDLEQQKQEAADRPEGASVPALGLSNKAVFADRATDLAEDLAIKPSDNEQYTETSFKAVSLNEPPSEEHLLQNTLWPEVQKLYGHGYEVFSLACDPHGHILASSSKAAKAEFASVILWDTATWQQLSSLEGHNLTVTQIVFSHSGEFLLTVSRDRTWYLYRRRLPEQPESDPVFSEVCHVDKKTCVHARIIWSCCWSHDDRYFLTASRDKKVVVWPCPSVPHSAGPTPVGKLDVPAPATAVDMAPVCLTDGRYLVSVGLENGHIHLYSWSSTSPSPWQQLVVLNSSSAHHLTVKRLRFRPCLGLAGIHGNNLSVSKVRKDKDDWLQLASCGADHAVKIFNIHIAGLVGNAV